MTNIDTFGCYVRARLNGWGREFALHRDCEYLGHASRNMLQVLIDHRGEMPPPNVGFKPLEVDADALEVERIVSDIARDNVVLACVLRAYHCGQGRRKVERWETANLLIATAGHPVIAQRTYLTLAVTGEAMVSGVLRGMALAAA
jgi:hypothetical protein